MIQNVRMSYGTTSASIAIAASLATAQYIAKSKRLEFYFFTIKNF